MSIKCKEILFKPNGPLGFKLTGGTTSITPHFKGKTDQIIPACNAKKTRQNAKD